MQEVQAGHQAVELLGCPFHVRIGIIGPFRLSDGLTTRQSISSRRLDHPAVLVLLEVSLFQDGEGVLGELNFEVYHQ
jgi:hypothetical protein